MKDYKKIQNYIFYKSLSEFKKVENHFFISSSDTLCKKTRHEHQIIEYSAFKNLTELYSQHSSRKKNFAREFTLTLKKYMDSYNYCAMETLISSTLEDLISQNTSLDLLHDSACLIFDVFLRHVATDKYADINICYMTISFITELRSLNTITELTEILSKYIQQYHSLTASNTDAHPILEVKQFIYDHYFENCTLTSAAKIVHMNPVYLGTLFYNKTGTHFIQFLIQHRIQVAKNLLNSTTFSVQEISRKVGYQDIKYFRKVFKKNVGVTPIEYRRKHR